MKDNEDEVKTDEIAKPVLPNAYERIAGHFDCIANIFASESCYPGAERAKDTANLFRGINDMLEANMIMEEYKNGKRDFRENK